MAFKKPFDGAISKFIEKDAPKSIRKLLREAKKTDVLAGDYPYPKWMKSKDYDKEYDALQIELVKLQAAVRESGERIAIVFEGRDAAGKGGAIKRFVENLNPRGARVVALSKPSDVEKGQWYFQRYIRHLPSAGEIVFFDRSWYNRAVVERVFGFSTDAERERFFLQVPEFEEMLAQDGVRLFKIWLTVSRAEQLRRFAARESDPLKQWKLSPIDIQGLGKWDAYTEAIHEMFERTHTAAAPWSVIRADCKHRARLSSFRRVLSALDYAGKDADIAAAPDPKIVGGPASMPVVTG